MNTGIGTDELTTVLTIGNREVKVIFRSYGYTNPSWNGDNNNIYVDINGYALVK